MPDTNAYSNVPAYIPLSGLKTRVASRKPGSLLADSTLHRWRQHGVRGVRLECVRIGGTWHTTEAAFSKFVAALNGGTPAISTPSRVMHANDIDAALDAAGY